MRLIIQRVKKASVTVNNKEISKISRGLLVLVGITHNDSEEIADYLVNKLVNLRIFEDENGKLNLSLKDINGELLLVSNFTLYADCSKGTRPSFKNAAGSKFAENLYNYFVKKCENFVPRVEEGSFGSYMQVNLVNDGPVTMVMEK